MEQAQALNALAPFLALAKSATSPRAAADLVTQATSAPNTYVFAELLQQPNVQALAADEQYAAFHELLKVFAWGTWEQYKATPGLPALTDAQTTKLKLLSLLTLAAQKPTTTTTSAAPTTPSHHLSYPALGAHLDLPHPLDLEHLVTQARYHDLLSATLNPAHQTVVITSVAPLRDLAPGSVGAMMAELRAWSGRCEAVLGELEREMEMVRGEARRRKAGEVRAERQVRAVSEAATAAGEKGGSGSGVGGSGLRAGPATRGAGKRGEDGGQEEEEEGDAMEVDGGGGGGAAALGGGGGKKRSTGGGGGSLGNLMGKMTGGRSGRG